MKHSKWQHTYIHTTFGNLLNQIWNSYNNKLCQSANREKVCEGERDLFGVVEALEVILTKERTVLGLSAARHAFAEVNPEIVTPPLVAADSPSRCHLLSSISADDRMMVSIEPPTLSVCLDWAWWQLANTLSKRNKWASAHQIFFTVAHSWVLD